MLEVLADRTYRHLFAAQVVALLGTGLATVALGLLAYDLAGDNAGLVLGTVFTIKMVAYVGIAPVAGAFADRVNRRALLVTLEPDFAELFKLQADFEESIDRSDDAQALFARVIGARAAKDGRAAIEDIRIIGGLGGSQADSNKAFWYRVSVRPLPESDEARKPLVIWSVEDITK